MVAGRGSEKRRFAELNGTLRPLLREARVPGLVQMWQRFAESARDVVELPMAEPALESPSVRSRRVSLPSFAIDSRLASGAA